MSVNEAASIPEQYPWPDRSGTLDTACARIARRLSLAPARVIGLLPADRSLAPPVSLAPLLERVGATLARHESGDVALVDTWHAWSHQWGASGTPRDAAAPRIAELQPRLLVIAPPPCEDAETAGPALRRALGALTSRPGGIAKVLVHLGGYAAPGIAPSALALMDGVVLLGAARRTRGRLLLALAGHIPASKNLGVILVG